MRGIVISPVKIIGKNSLSIDGDFDPVEIRNYLLYWDMIDFPINNIIGFGLSPELEYLKSIGKLKQTKVNVMLNGEVADLYVKSQLIALNQNNKINSGCWSLGQSNIDILLPKEEVVMDRSIEVDLYKCLPIPTADVHFDDILYFKDKRKDELLEFRLLMDNFYLELIKSGDSERALASYTQKVQLKILEIDKVLNESKISRFIGSVKIRFNLKKAISNGLIGGAVGQHFNFPTTGAVIGFANSFININSEMSLKPKGIPSELKDYAYLYYANKELSVAK